MVHRGRRSQTNGWAQRHLLCGESPIFAIHGWLTGALAEGRAVFKAAFSYATNGAVELKKE
ncbi:hypothetical protein [Peribacillus simplex]|uniref:hypothetical protein n=1 Tax=Peribacillus simplex TaxID=1478 RepID=UPI0024C15D1E|nr:hypothetical protein [Peribacillus simplex]WHY98554.1 hypothetical protein QNH37_05100 [Peribacillus simplex]